MSNPTLTSTGASSRAKRYTARSAGMAHLQVAH